jgi:hypothetical protein
MLEELHVPNDQIEVLGDGKIQVREATYIARDGAIDPEFPPRYRRYVLEPGSDVHDKDARIASVAQAVWTPEVVAAHRARSDERGVGAKE